MNNLDSQLHRRWLDALRSSLWFLPAAIVLFAILLALAMVALDSRGHPAAWAQLPLLLVSSAETARATLSSIAGSMMTVGGVVFSITIVVLTLAASQYSPRIIRNFMRDRVAQTVLGVFLGVFAYCMLVLSTIEDGDRHFVPTLSIAVGIVLALVAMGHLVLYIHHVARSIQAAYILASAAAETLAAVDEVFPTEARASDPVEARLPAAPRTASHTIQAQRTGYVQRIDIPALVRCADRHDRILELKCAVGAFVSTGAELVVVSGSPASSLDSAVRAAFIIDRFQTVEQDVAYGIRGIVDVALRALSPALNDETTAAEAIDYLGAVLLPVAQRPPAPVRHGCNGCLRVVVQQPAFERLLGLAFDQILRIGAGSPETLQRILGALANVRAAAASSIYRDAVDAEIRRVAEAAGRSVDDPGARHAVLLQAQEQLDRPQSEIRPT